MKNEYLNKLRELLDRYDMDENEKQDILNDYEAMFDGWKETGMSDEEVTEKLGKPRSIIGSLTEGYRRIPKPQTPGTKLIAIMPFVSLIIFFVLGFGFNGWLYSWIAFLLIPVVAIIVGMKDDEDAKAHITTALSPFAATIGYLIIGFYYNLWHPGWLIFLIIPVLGIFNSRKEMSFVTLLTSLSPFAAVIAFVMLGEEGLWDPGWMVFLLIPFLGILHDENKGRMLLNEVLLVAGVIGYLFMMDMFTEWYIKGLVFLPFIALNIYNGNIQIGLDSDTPKGYKITVLATVLAYFAVSFITGWWEITWIIFFAIPVYAILRETDGPETTIAITPFIATSLFMILGFAFGVWAWAWIAFLIIPVVAIYKSV